MSQRFDPRQHLRELSDGTPYLDVKWRLHWLRSEHPEAIIETQLVSLDGDTAVCKATVRIPEGGSATGHASSTREPGRNADHIEHAETRAIGRALAALGYGTQFTEDDLQQGRAAAQAERPTERPVSLVTPPATTPPPPTRMRPVREDSDEDDAPPPPRPEPREPVDVRDSRNRGEERPVREVREVIETDEPDTDEQPLPTPLKRGSDLRPRSDQPSADAPAREDISWTRFWDWAKRRGYRDAAHLKELLGIDVNALTPGEVRDRIRRYELDNPPE
jgi:outer membrane biosynthesis protein TonB